MRDLGAWVWCRYCKRHEKAGTYRGLGLLASWHSFCRGPRSRDAEGQWQVRTAWPTVVKAGDAAWPCVPFLTLIGRIRRFLGLPIGEEEPRELPTWDDMRGILADPPPDGPYVWGTGHASHADFSGLFPDAPSAYDEDASPEESPPGDTGGFMTTFGEVMRRYGPAPPEPPEVPPDIETPAAASGAPDRDYLAEDIVAGKFANPHPPEPTWPKHRCKVCGASFGSADELDEHLGTPHLEPGGPA